MRVTICIGSACHLKGSREIIHQLQELVEEHGVGDKVDLNGAFLQRQLRERRLRDRRRGAVFPEPRRIQRSFLRLRS